MRVIGMLLVAVFCFCSVALAQETNTTTVSTVDIGDIVNQIPLEKAKEGIVYSYDDSKVKPITSYSFIEGMFGVEKLSIDLGYIFEDEEGVINISYKLINLREDWNVKAWIFDLVDISITAGYGLKNIGTDNEGDVLIGSGEIKFKF